MYVLAKFQLHILKAFEVTALYKVTATERSICTCSKHREDKRSGYLTGHRLNIYK